MLELEILGEELRKKYHIDFVSFWRETLTLGELFRHVYATEQDASSQRRDL